MSHSTISMPPVWRLTSPCGGPPGVQPFMPWSTTTGGVGYGPSPLPRTKAFGMPPPAPPSSHIRTLDDVLRASANAARLQECLVSNALEREIHAHKREDGDSNPLLRLLDDLRRHGRGPTVDPLLNAPLLAPAVPVENTPVLRTSYIRAPQRLRICSSCEEEKAELFAQANPPFVFHPVFWDVPSEVKPAAQHRFGSLDLVKDEALKQKEEARKQKAAGRVVIQEFNRGPVKSMNNTTPRAVADQPRRKPTHAKPRPTARLFKLCPNLTPRKVAPRAPPAPVQAPAPPPPRSWPTKEYMERAQARCLWERGLPVRRDRIDEPRMLAYGQCAPVGW